MQPMQPNQPMPASPEAARAARAQASAYKSVFAPTPMELTYPDGTTETIEIPPHPNLRMLDDPQLEAYEELLFEAETTYDREPDIVLPEQRLDNGIIIPADTRKGVLKTPYRRTVTDESGENPRVELVKPPWAIKVAEVALGKEKFDKIIAAGKHASDVWRIWNEQGLELADRQDADPKNVRRGRNVAPTSA